MKIRLLFLIFLLVGIFYACRKTSASRQESQVTSPTTFTIGQAKSYLDSSLHSTSSSLKLASIDSSKNTNPTGFVYWKKARQLKAQNFSVVEIPLITTNVLITLHDDPRDSVKIKPDVSVARAMFARLIIYQDNSTKKISKEILIYQPDKAYLQKHHNDASGNWLDKLALDFSGYIEYRTFDGTVKYVLRIKNGKTSARYNLTSLKTTSKQVQDLPPADSEVCDQECDPAYNENCSTDDEGNTICYVVYSGYDECYYYCYDDGSDPDPDPDPQPPSGGGGGGGTIAASGNTVNMSNVPAWGADMTQTYPGSCVFMNMEIVGDILGVNVTEDGLIATYATANNETQPYVEQNGIPNALNDYSNINNFIANYFNETPISSDLITNSIDNGNPVMGFIIQAIVIQNGNPVVEGHEVTVYSYSTDTSGNTTYNYIDTVTGTNQSTTNSGKFGDPISISTK